MKFDVAIIGGGLAGLTASIHLQKLGYRVVVFEKQQYPRHKVCGEYVSNEVLPYLQYLGVSFEDYKLPAINQLEFSTRSGRLIETALPLGGFGISRFAFDHLLYKRAMQLGVHFIFDTVKTIAFTANQFSITIDNHTSFKAPFAIGAFGKRSGLDKALNRKFIEKNRPG